MMPTRAAHQWAPAVGLSCLTCPSRERAQWCALPPEAAKALDGAKASFALPAGATLYAPGEEVDGIYCLRSGAVAVRKEDEAGHMVLVRLAFGGQIVGYRDFFRSRKRTFQVETVVPSRVCRVAGPVFHDLLRTNPALTQQFLTRMARDVDSAERNAHEQQGVPLRTRLVHVLLALQERHASPGDAGSLVLRLPLSYGELAPMLGASTAEVDALFAALEAEGLARLEGETVRLPDPDALLQPALV